ncbi:MAG TPA: hypothetical protein VK780_01160 [Thermoanaerobaculia bacterium]|nr:hypothetical protein [Thermoanaerobaculia bacterium]
MPSADRSAAKMFRTLRIARFVQVALAVACVLAVTGSVGLHPEPGGASAADASHGSAWKRPQPPDGPSHGCLACLAYRSIPLARLFGFVLQPGACAVSATPSPTPPVLAVASAPHEGRAPPAFS